MTPTASDHRLLAIKDWLNEVLPERALTIEPASSDASFRRYFRVCSGNQSWIVMDAPPDKEGIQPFVNIARFLSQHGLHAPDIIAEHHEQGFLLLSDLGKTPYLDALNDDSADDLYGDAINSLIHMQSLATDSISLPRYDAALLRQELELFPEWFLTRHLQIETPDFIEPLFDTLIESALNQPQVIVHRDYHSRNLMVFDGNNPGIIDFQDAVIGPISYDLVSLLRDCYIAWPEDKVQQWVQCYFDRAQQQGLLNGTSFDTFLRWFDLMGVQRHLKVLGIFCRLNYRDNKPHYLAGLPQTFRYTLAVSQRYEALEPLADFLATTAECQHLL